MQTAAQAHFPQVAGTAWQPGTRDSSRAARSGAQSSPEQHPQHQQQGAGAKVHRRMIRTAGQSVSVRARIIRRYRCRPGLLADLARFAGVTNASRTTAGTECASGYYMSGKGDGGKRGRVVRVVNG
jgi:hypothetical protein